MTCLRGKCPEVDLLVDLASMKQHLDWHNGISESAQLRLYRLDLCGMPYRFM